VAAVVGKIKAPELVANLLEMMVLEDGVTSLLKITLLASDVDVILGGTEETVGGGRVRIGAVERTKVVVAGVGAVERATVETTWVVAGAFIG
jgi:hypothetical protein